jgi:two-component system, OmpR family, sensor histidine kinase KdpD
VKRLVAISAVEVLVAVALATGGIAALQTTTPPERLGILYLPAVLAVAIRRGQLAALATAVLGVLTFNFFYIAPRHRLAIAHSQDVVELIVLLVTAIVVGRLAAAGRARAAEAESRARIAAAREREAQLVAQAASAILAGDSVGAQLGVIAHRVADAVQGRARVELGPVPAPAGDETAIPLPAGEQRAWLYVSQDASWAPAELERIAEPLGRLVAVAVERERVAEREAETEAARRAEVAKTAVLHAISHDLRSPLTAIATAGSALGAPGVTPGERAEMVEVIEVESARLAKLVDDLLDLSRIESGAVAPQSDWIDLRDVVASAVMQAHVDSRIEFAVPADLPLVRADAAQLERVFSNLIDNALKFSPPDAPVRVSGGAAGGRVTIRVTDFGPGIPRRDRANVFEPFFRGRGDSGSGSGLGLAICRGFVEANDGHLVLQSGADRGNSFSVSLPAAHPEPDGRTPEAPSSGVPATS